MSLLLLLGAAEAGVSDYNGTYELECTDLELTVSTSISGAVGGSSGSTSASGTLPLDCDGIDDSERDAWADDLEDDCTDAGLDEGFCEDLADDLSEAVADFNDDAVYALPTEMTTKAWASWWSKWTKLYTMRGTHAFPDRSQSWNYLLSDRPYDQGRFVTAGAALNGAGSTEHLVCADVSLAGVDGEIDASDHQSLEADWAVSRSLVCLASDGSNWLVATVSMALSGTMEGER